MSVKNLLRKQDENFISLHDVLKRMAASDGSTYQEAAIVLHRLLRTTDRALRPKWYWQSDLYGLKPIPNQESGNPWNSLERAARTGHPVTYDDFEDDIPF